jgi:hypothetical protein
MVSEASAAIGVTPYLLRKWIAEDKTGFGPSRKVMFGSTQIYLYTEEDLYRIKINHQGEQQVIHYDGRRGKGRPRQFSPEERTQRGRLQSRKYYWKVRLEEAMFKGDYPLMDKANKEIDKIDKKLRSKK